VQAETAGTPQSQPGGTRSQPKSGSGRSWWPTVATVAVMLGLSAVAFFLGFRFATDSDITVGELLRFIRQLYQWFGAS